MTTPAFSLPEQVVHEPPHDDDAGAEGDRHAVRHRDHRVLRHQPPVPVDERQQQDATHPGEGCFPLEPVQRPVEQLRLFLLVDDVEPAAVNHPDLALMVKRMVEPGEEIGLSDPHDRGKDVGPAKGEIQPLLNGIGHGQGPFVAMCAEVYEEMPQGKRLQLFDVISVSAGLRGARLVLSPAG